MADDAATGGGFIAVDWGTTNRRVWRIEGGVATAGYVDARGVSVLAPDQYATELADIRARLGDLPVLLAGMVGSDMGWRAVPYVPAPAGLADVSAAVVAVGDRIGIVPGLCVRGPGLGDVVRGDVMRGEEVQLLGAAAAGLVPPDALLCQPGTHCKWVRLEHGRIVDFTTAMTGELFALLRTRGSLATRLTADVTVGPAFREGVAEGARRDLAASLFGVRAAGLLGVRADADAAAFASGVLIGAEVAARFAATPDRAVHVVADGVLAGLYAAAIDDLGGHARLVECQAAFVAGMVRIREFGA